MQTWARSFDEDAPCSVNFRSTESSHGLVYRFGRQVEEQLADETYEQFEERVLNKRAAAMFHLVRAKLQLSDSIPFSEMIYKNNKKQVNLYL